MPSPLLRISREGQILGEFTAAEVAAKIKDGSLRSTDAFWAKGMDNWAPVSALLCAMEAVRSESVAAENSSESPKTPETPASPLTLLGLGGLCAAFMVTLLALRIYRHRENEPSHVARVMAETAVLTALKTQGITSIEHTSIAEAVSRGTTFHRIQGLIATETTTSANGHRSWDVILAWGNGCQVDSTEIEGEAGADGNLDPIWTQILAGTYQSAEQRAAIESKLAAERAEAEARAREVQAREAEAEATRVAAQAAERQRLADLADAAQRRARALKEEEHWQLLAAIDAAKALCGATRSSAIRESAATFQIRAGNYAALRDAPGQPLQASDTTDANAPAVELAKKRLLASLGNPEGIRFTKATAQRARTSDETTYFYHVWGELMAEDQSGTVATLPWSVILECGATVDRKTGEYRPGSYTISEDWKSSCLTWSLDTAGSHQEDIEPTK